MRKVLSLFLSLILYFNLFLFSPTLAFAAPVCILTTIPEQVTTNDTTIDLSVGVPGLVANKDYRVWFVEHGGLITDLNKTEAQGSRNFPTDSSGSINIQKVDGIGRINSTNPSNFISGVYTVRVTDVLSGILPTSPYTTYCENTFVVKTALAGGSCNISIVSPRTSDKNLIIKVGNLQGNPNDEKQIAIARVGGDTTYQNQTIQSLSSGYDTGQHLEAGDYKIKISQPAILGIFGNDQLCYGQFTIYSPGGEPQNEQSDVTATPPPPSGPCTLGPRGSCPTVFGDISTNPADFVKTLFGILLSLSGGIAIILIMISGYGLMFSGGNPEKVQASREQLTAAIVGLLFIIFSMSILQIIGIDILHIPGLTRTP